MTTRNVFTVLTPLPPSVGRETAVGCLHRHGEMLDLNPLIIGKRRIEAPEHAPADERRCVWYAITERLAFWPSSHVSFTCAFHDLDRGLQTHCYAPLGVDLRETWSVAGSRPGEPLEPVELGIGAPPEGLYLREDIDLRCNFVLAGFVKKSLRKAHAVFVEHLVAEAEKQEREHQQHQHPMPEMRQQATPVELQ